MRVNVVSLRIQSNKRFVRLRPVNEEMLRKAESADEHYHAHPRYLVLTHDEARHAIQCLRGEAGFSPYYNDSAHLVRFSPDGFEEIYLNGSSFERFYFTLPGSELAHFMTYALGNAPTDDNKEFTVDIPATTLLQWAVDYAPVVKWEYTPVYGEYNTAYDYLHRDLSDLRQTGLQNCLDGLRRIAVNHSDGIASVIRISLDRLPDENPSDYYWTIHAMSRKGEDYRVMNGGIIGHKDDGAGYTVWRYSTHT